MNFLMTSIRRKIENEGVYIPLIVSFSLISHTTIFLCLTSAFSLQIGHYGSVNSHIYIMKLTHANILIINDVSEKKPSLSQQTPSQMYCIVLHSTDTRISL